MTAGMYGANAPSLLRGLVVRVKRKVSGGGPPALQAGLGGVVYSSVALLSLHI